ncbi:hypothetical protein [Tianweitania sp.]|uniref:hypothetical protein n=1 Tax=Tianweitania sp. TaxID=2021634 RepID=UPI00289F100C|nr:hypothetical protein [Tianweitania sp.]
MGNAIHPTAIIEGAVELGDGNEIGPYSVIIGPVRLGDDNLVSPFVTIGTPGQDTKNPRYDSRDKLISIGDRNIIREHTTIQKPAYENVTQVGDDVHIMSQVHVPHDALIQDGVVIAPMVALAGLCRILKGANIALGSSVHQRTVVGQYSIVGMGAAAIRHIRPFSKFIPRSPPMVNSYAIKKFGFSEYSEEIEAYVINGLEPTSPSLRSIVEEFYVMCEDRNRNI